MSQLIANPDKLPTVVPTHLSAVPNTFALTVALTNPQLSTY